MGLLNSISNVAKAVVKAVTPTKAKLQNVVDVVSIAVNPFSKDTIVANTGSKTVNKVLETVANHPYVAAAVATTAIAPTAAKAVATAGLKVVAESSTKAKVITAVATPVVIGAVAQNPVAAAQKVVAAPSELFNFGTDISKVASNPSVSSIKELVKESPILTTATAAAAAVAVGAGTAGLITSVANTLAVKENTAKNTLISTPQTVAAVLPSTPLSAATPIIPTTTVSSPVASTTASPVPVTPATQPLIATAGSKVSTTKRKTYKKKPVQTMRQTVNIGIANNQNSGRFINRRSYSNSWD